MGLYQLAKKLQMTRQDLGHIIHRPGEVHIVMDQLRTIGAFIENSGLGRVGSIWAFHCEADSRWEPREERRSSAHGYITSSIQPLLGSLLRETPSCVTIVKKSTNQLSDACKKGDKQDITAKHKELAQTITSTELAAKMEQFDAHHEDSPLFKFT